MLTPLFLVIFTSSTQLKYLKFELINHEHVATLIDS